MNHTPGPWQLQKFCEDLVIENAHRRVRAEIAEVTQWDTNMEESDANARLIAAAPDLLEACCAILDCDRKSLEPWMGWMDNIDAAIMMDKIAAAIAKATTED